MPGPSYVFFHLTRCTFAAYIHVYDNNISKRASCQYTFLHKDVSAAEFMSYELVDMALLCEKSKSGLLIFLSTTLM